MEEQGQADDANGILWRFANAEFNEPRRELRVGGQVVDIEQRPLDVLSYLLHHAGEVVTKEELLDAAWPGSIVVDNALTNAIGKLRKQLGDNAAELIKTRHGVGYQLTGTVHRKLIRAAAPEITLKTGSRVPNRDNWVLTERLDSSDNSEVWRCEHAKTKEQRVFKFALDGGRLTALKREATVGRLLRKALGDRPDYVRVIDWNFDTAPFFLEFEHGGTNLPDWAEQRGGLQSIPMDERLRLMADIADAVGEAHSVGVLHKDLKPANILVTECDGHPQIRIADFGSSRLTEPAQLEALGITRLGLTTQGSTGDSLSGTPLYVAPEVMSGEAATVKADIYALGVMLYQLAVADFRRPISAGWERDITDPLLRRDIAESAAGTPKERIASASELAQRLRTIASRRDLMRSQQKRDAEAAELDAQLRLQRARRPWVYAAFFVLALGTVVSATLYWQADHQRQAAEENAARADAMLAFFSEELVDRSNSYKSGSNTVTLTEALVSASQSVTPRFESTPRVERFVQEKIGDLLGTLSEHQRAQEAYARALELIEAAENEKSEDWLRVATQLAFVASRAGDYEVANDTIDRIEAVAGSAVNLPLKLQIEIAKMQRTQAISAADWEAAAKSAAEVANLAESVPESDRAFVLRERGVHGQFLAIAGKPDEAEQVIDAALTEARAQLGESHATTLWLELYNIMVAYYQGPISHLADQAATLADRSSRVLGESHDVTLGLLNFAATGYGDAGKHEFAARSFERQYMVERHKNDKLTNNAIAFLVRTIRLYERADLTTHAIDLAKPVVDAQLKSAVSERPPQFPSLHFNFINLLLKSDQLEIAKTYAMSFDEDAFLALRPESSQREMRAMVSIQKGRLAAAEKNYDAARDMLKQGIGLLKEAENSELYGYEFELAQNALEKVSN